VAQHVDVIQADGGDDRHLRPQDIGGIQPAAHAYLEHAPIDPLFREIHHGQAVMISNTVTSGRAASTG
jgi:hypothetical protein